ncbi:MAG: hypothetical protein QW500_01935 [Candidatus Micrarchaeia archaeon]
MVDENLLLGAFFSFLFIDNQYMLASEVLPNGKNPAAQLQVSSSALFLILSSAHL